jgi:hypothetical protein
VLLSVLAGVTAYKPLHGNEVVHVVPAFLVSGRLLVMLAGDTCSGPGPTLSTLFLSTSLVNRRAGLQVQKQPGLGSGPGGCSLAGLIPGVGLSTAAPDDPIFTVHFYLITIDHVLLITAYPIPTSSLHHQYGPIMITT